MSLRRFLVSNKYVKLSGGGVHSPCGERDLKNFHRRYRVCHPLLRTNRRWIRHCNPCICFTCQRLPGALRRRLRDLEKPLCLQPCLRHIFLRKAEVCKSRLQQSAQKPGIERSLAIDCISRSRQVLKSALVVSDPCFCLTSKDQA